MMKQMRQVVKNLVGGYMEEINRVLKLFRDKELKQKILTYILMVQERGELTSYEDMDILKDILIAFALQKTKNINTAGLLKSTFLARCFEYRRGFWDKTISELHELIFVTQTKETKTEPTESGTQISKEVKEVEEKVEKEAKENEENKIRLDMLFAFANKVWEKLKIPEKMPKQFVWALRDKMSSYTEEDILMFATIFRRTNPAGGWKLFINQLPSLSIIAKALKNQNTILKSKLVNQIWRTLIHKEDYVSLEMLPKLGQMSYKFVKAKILDLSKSSVEYLPNINSFLDKIFKEWAVMTEPEKAGWRNEGKNLMLEDARKSGIQVVLDEKGKIVLVNSNGGGVLV